MTHLKHRIEQGPSFPVLKIAIPNLHVFIRQPRKATSGQLHDLKVI